jgi:hypothetical protein
LWHNVCEFIGSCEFEHNQPRVFEILKDARIPNVKPLNVNVLNETTILTPNDVINARPINIAEFNIFVPKYSKINPSSYSEQVTFKGMLGYMELDGEIEQGTILCAPNNQLPGENFLQLKNKPNLFHEGNNLLLNESIISALLDLKDILGNNIIQVSINNNICRVIVQLNKSMLSYNKILDRVEEHDVRVLLAILHLNKIVAMTVDKA